MTKFRKIWDEEKNNWLIEHKQMARHESYLLFMKQYPDSEVTETAFNNQRSRVGAVENKCSHGSTLSRPLFSEQTKKGYVRIKIAQPNVWISKARWVYEQSHPEYIFQKGDHFFFLDGNNRNFEANNIEVVNTSYQTKFIQLGGVVNGQPELTKLHILQARMINAMYNLAEKNGLTKNYGAGRVFITTLNERAATYRNRPEVKKKNAERTMKRYSEIKKDPARYAEYQAKRKEYLKKYYERKKGK